MVNPVSTFMNFAVQQGSMPTKDYLDGLKKAVAPLVKSSSAELDKCIDLLLAKNNITAPLFLIPLKSRRVDEVNDLAKFSGQIRKLMDETLPNTVEYVADKFINAMTAFAVFAMDKGKPLMAIRIIQSAIDKLTEGVKGCLTDLHHVLFQLCLRANRFDPALPYMDLCAGDVFKQPSHLRMHILPCLLYFYYGGLIYTALEDFERAAFFLQACVTMPATQASAIMVEALKKLTLVKVLLNKPIGLAAYRSAAIQRASQQKCATIFNLALAYQDILSRKKDRSLKDLYEIIEKATPELKKEKNYGLSLEVYDRCLETLVAQLPNVFTKLQVSAIPEHINASINEAAALALLEKLIYRQTIRGKIDSRTRTVIFDSEQSSKATEADLENAMQASLKLADLLYKCHHEASLHSAYVSKALVRKSYNMGLDDEGVIPGSSS